MTLLNDVIGYILSFESFVLLPLLLFVISLIVRMKINDAIKASLSIGVGFIGINLVIGYFISNMGPAVEGMVSRLDLGFTALDAGWAPMALVTWGTEFTGPLILMLVVINGLMLVTGLTKTLNIDLFNFWHFMYGGIVVYVVTDSVLLMFLCIAVTSIFILKFSDWMGDSFEQYSGVEGVTSTTLSAVSYYPISLILDKVFDRIPGFRDIHVDAEAIQKRFGILGEPLTIGLIIGLSIGVASGYEVKEVLALGMKFAAVIFLLPKMCSVLADGLSPISETMTAFVQKKFPKSGKTYVAVDIALILGDASVIVTGLFMIPILILLALILPGVNYIPLADLAMIMVVTSTTNVVNGGNVIRSVVTGIPLAVIHLYLGSWMASTYTDVANAYNYSVEGYDGLLTSTMDGGNAYRVFMIELFSSNRWAYIALPLFILLTIVAYKIRHPKVEENN